MLKNEVFRVLESTFLNFVLKGHKINFSDLENYFVKIKLNNSFTKTVEEQIFLAMTIDIFSVENYLHAETITNKEVGYSDFQELL